MIANTFSLRRAAAAFVFPANPGLTRDDNLKFYDKVTSKGVDVPVFQQQPANLILRREVASKPPTTFGIQVGEHHGQFRFLVHEEWPTKPVEMFIENADIAWDGFREVWPLRSLGGWPILREASLRFSAAAEGGDASAYIRDRILRIPHGSLERLGRGAQGYGLKLMLPVEIRVGQDADQLPLSGADANISIETLLDDPSKLYVEVISKWPSLPIPAEIRKQVAGAPETLNEGVEPPSFYIRALYDFVFTRVANFLAPTA